ncbi:MAG: glycosyltransferase [Chromatiales bacterium]|jgi:glycosyltransferase involved in cell wall biosynthesis|nr:glycosyltransferase [Chromatiales bacterium]
MQNDTKDMPDTAIDTQAPRFSVVIPLYNHERYVGEAIRSVLDQTEPDLELIVVDDGSSDGSAACVRAFDDPRIRYLHQPNSGTHAALNHGLRLARGKYVAVLNSDDVYAPERLETAGRLLDADPGLAAVFSGYDFIDQYSAPIRNPAEIACHFPDPAKVMDAAFDRIDPRERMVLRLLGGNFFHTSSNLICRREVFEEVGPFAPYRYVHDYDLFLRLAHRHPVHFDPTPLLHYRYHLDNTLCRKPAASVLETARMLAHFLFTHRLAVLDRRDEVFIAATHYLYRCLRLYGADRVLLAMLLADVNGRARDDAIPDLFAADADAEAFIDRQLLREHVYEVHERGPAWRQWNLPRIRRILTRGFIILMHWLRGLRNVL